MRTIQTITLAASVAALVILLGGCSSSSTSPGDAVPAADLTVTPVAGTVITDFVFDASGSVSGNRSLEFRWDWQNDGAWDTDWSSESSASRRFASGDTIVVLVGVREGTKIDSVSVSFTLDTRHGEIVSTLAFPQGRIAYGLTNDGTDFWFTGWMDDIYKIDAVTGAVVDSIDGLTNWTGSITWDGTHLWVKDGTTLYERDPETGATLSSFNAAYSGICGGVAWDGEEFYVGSDQTDRDGDGLIHTYTPDGTETGSFPSPRGSVDPRDLAFDGESLWVTILGPDTLYVVNPDDGTVQRTVGVPNLNWFATVKDGYVWAVTWAGSDGHLVRIVP